MAANLTLGLANGGLASITANYLNPRGTGVWGDESLRILGTLGMIESTRGGRQSRFIIGERDCGAIDTTGSGMDYFEEYLRTIAGEGKMPLTMEEELSPTRWVIRAKRSLVG